MDTTRVFKWQNYELLCSAKPVDAGRFAPNLVISKQVWPTRPREIAVPRGQHLTEDTAIDAASHENSFKAIFPRIGRIRTTADVLAALQ